MECLKVVIAKFSFSRRIGADQEEYFKVFSKLSFIGIWDLCVKAKMKVLLQVVTYNCSVTRKKLVISGWEIFSHWLELYHTIPAKILYSFDEILAAFSIWQQCQRVVGELRHPDQELGVDPQLRRLC